MPFDGSAHSNYDYVVDPRAAALDRVIDLLAAPERWCKNTMTQHAVVVGWCGARRMVTQYCMLGALATLSGYSEDLRLDVRIAVLRAIREVTGVAYTRIDYFNDNPMTDHALVLRVLLLARVKLAAGERYDDADRNDYYAASDDGPMEAVILAPAPVMPLFLPGAWIEATVAKCRSVFA